jgi:putative intracellular protease/amidase
MAKVLMPLPALDFDPTEAAVSFRVLRDAGHTVIFATPDGTRAAADDLMITGEGLDPWGFVPGLKKLTALGGILRANADGRSAYAELESAPAFLSPLRYDDLDDRVGDFDGFVFPGGHRARGMRPYLESLVLQTLVVRAFALEKPVAAVCHGVLLVARSIVPETGRSVLYGKRTTSLTWSQERLAARLARVARFWDPLYYRTYPDPPDQPCGYMGVQAEVTRALESPEHYVDVLSSAPDHGLKTDGRHRDTLTDDRPAFVVEDQGYLSARWPGDVHTFAKRFAAMLSARAA